MQDENRLAKAAEAAKGQSQQDSLRRPEDIDVVGAPKGVAPQTEHAPEAGGVGRDA